MKYKNLIFLGILVVIVLIFYFTYPSFAVRCYSLNYDSGNVTLVDEGETFPVGNIRCTQEELSAAAREGSGFLNKINLPENAEIISAVDLSGYRTGGYALVWEEGGEFYCSCKVVHDVPSGNGTVENCDYILEHIQDESLAYC